VLFPLEFILIEPLTGFYYQSFKVVEVGTNDALYPVVPLGKK
jgi:hypothetical protein